MYLVANNFIFIRTTYLIAKKNTHFSLSYSLQACFIIRNLIEEFTIEIKAKVNS